jgi:hypothetical protein
VDETSEHVEDYSHVSETRRVSEHYALPHIGSLAAIEAALRHPSTPASRHPLLVEREFTHGNFSATALIAQRFKDVARNTPNWGSNLTDIQRESLEAIFTKLARILSGNPHHLDHWRDIEGQAHLVSETLE